MNVVLFGATGFTGKQVLKQLLAEDHTVTVLVRNASRLHTQDPNLRVREGDVLDPLILESIITGQDAVINCLGKAPGTPDDFISTATKLIVQAMESTGVQRFIALSNVGAGDSYRHQPWIFRKIVLPYFLKWLQVIIDDKNVMEPIVRNSTLDWTILRFPNIVDKKTRKTLRTSLTGRGLKLWITLTDMAAFITGQLTDLTFLRQSPSVSN